jgi:hypothetical protein
MADEEDRRWQALLTEYQTAQSSAEHHDGLVWTVSGLVWGASFVLLGFVLNVLAGGGTNDEQTRFLLLVASVLGVALNVVVWLWALQLRSLKNWKYERCQKIEERLYKDSENEEDGARQGIPLRQHRDVARVWRQKSALNRMEQSGLYGILMTLFIAAWVAVGLLPLVGWVWALVCPLVGVIALCILCIGQR